MVKRWVIADVADSAASFQPSKAAIRMGLLRLKELSLRCICRAYDKLT
jgi:hypothetical protein